MCIKSLAYLWLCIVYCYILTNGDMLMFKGGVAVGIYRISENVSIFKFYQNLQLLKIAKSPVLSTGGNENSKSRYGNNLKILGQIHKTTKKRFKKKFNYIHYTEMHS